MREEFKIVAKERNKIFRSIIKTHKPIRSLFFLKPRSMIHTNASLNPEYQVKLFPQPLKTSKILIPISMGRYNDNKDKREKYDTDIHNLLTYTSEALRKGDVASVDVLSTAGLQEITWGREKSEKIENHFISVHSELLAKQTAFYKWDAFQNKLGKEELAKNYQMVKEASNVDSEWYNLMVKGWKNMKPINKLERPLDTLESSLHYQRLEYSAIYTMKKEYTNITYMGNITPGWAYLYRIYDGLPVFSKVTVEKSQQPKRVTDTPLTVSRMIQKNVVEILLDKNFPIREKQKMSEALINLIYAYTPKNSIEEDKSKENSISFNK